MITNTDIKQKLLADGKVLEFGFNYLKVIYGDHVYLIKEDGIFQLKKEDETK